MKRFDIFVGSSLQYMKMSDIHNHPGLSQLSKIMTSHNKSSLLLWVSKKVTLLQFDEGTYDLLENFLCNIHFWKGVKERVVLVAYSQV